MARAWRGSGRRQVLRSPWAPLRRWYQGHLQWLASTRKMSALCRASGLKRLMPGNLLRTDTFTSETASNCSLHVRLRATARILLCLTQEHRGVLLLDAIHAQNPRGWESHGLEFIPAVLGTSADLWPEQMRPFPELPSRRRRWCWAPTPPEAHNFRSQLGFLLQKRIMAAPPSEAPCSAPTRLAPVG